MCPTRYGGGRGEGRHRTHRPIFSKTEMYPVCALLPESIFLARGRGRGGGRGGVSKVCTIHVCVVVYVLCIPAGGSREEARQQTHPREPVPERGTRPPIPESISYLPIKGERFVQFILNHGTVTRDVNKRDGFFVLRDVLPWFSPRRCFRACVQDVSEYYVRHIISTRPTDFLFIRHFLSVIWF